MDKLTDAQLAGLAAPNYALEDVFMPEELASMAQALALEVQEWRRLEAERQQMMDDIFNDTEGK